MTDWTTVGLTGQPNWDPTFLMLEEFHWPVAWITAPLSDLTRSLEPNAEVRAGTPVITLAGLDRVTGALKSRSTKFQGLAYRVGEQEEGLRAGDLLIPPSDGPVLFVSPDLVGSLVSARFLALRCVEVPGVWVWAVLGSESGRVIRRRLNSFERGLAAVRMALREIAIPLPPAEHLARVLPALERIEHATRGQEDEAQGSWWTTADLTGTPWHHVLATAHPDRLLSGEPLASYCESIVRGANLDRSAPTEAGPGLLPVAANQVLGGRLIRNYVVAESARVIAEPGDILVGVIGERANAREVDQPMAVDSSVYLLRPFTSELGPKLVRFLNGTEGLARRRLANRSAYAPQISIEDLRTMRIPDGALEQPDNRGVGPMEKQLEDLLWSNN